jgi:hypothetical protein
MTPRPVSSAGVPEVVELTEAERQHAALGSGPNICRALSPDRTFMCDLDSGHEGDHQGFELPTVTIDEDF